MSDEMSPEVMEALGLVRGLTLPERVLGLERLLTVALIRRPDLDELITALDTAPRPADIPPGEAGSLQRAEAHAAGVAKLARELRDRKLTTPRGGPR